MKTVAIIGNCQISAIADMLRRTGACEVDEFRLPQFKVDGKVSVNPAVFHQVRPSALPGRAGPVAGSGLRASEGGSSGGHPSRVIRFPSFLFTGLQRIAASFTPAGAASRRRSAPIPPESSRPGSSSGSIRKDVVASFNAYTYAKLGFFQEYETAVAYMRATFAVVGFDFDAILADLGSERFMHCINHPASPPSTAWRVRSPCARIACRRFARRP